MFGIPLEYLITYIVRTITMAKPTPLTKEEKAELLRIRAAQAKKNSTETPVTNVDTETLKREDPVARMMKKGYSKGGAMKKKGAKKGGKVRGVGIARKGFRPVKIR